MDKEYIIMRIENMKQEGAATPDAILVYANPVEKNQILGLISFPSLIGHETKYFYMPISMWDFLDNKGMKQEIWTPDFSDLILQKRNFILEDGKREELKCYSHINLLKNYYGSAFFKCEMEGVYLNENKNLRNCTKTEFGFFRELMISSFCSVRLHSLCYSDGIVCREIQIEAGGFVDLCSLPVSKEDLLNDFKIEEEESLELFHSGIEKIIIEEYYGLPDENNIRLKFYQSAYDENDEPSDWLLFEFVGKTKLPHSLSNYISALKFS